MFRTLIKEMPEEAESASSVFHYMLNWEQDKPFFANPQIS
jgi:hypothetical protein